MAHEEDHIKEPKEDQPQQEQQQEDPFAEASYESESGSDSHYEEHPSDPFAEAESESESESDSDSGSDSDYDELPSDPQSPYYTRPGEFEDIPEEDNSQDANVRRFARVLQSRRLKRAEEEEDRRFVYHEDLFDFPKDRENWREEDLKELWADAPLAMTKPGWDSAFADEEDLDVVRDEIVAGRDPPIAPFYLPYRKCYPAIPDNHYDISNPKSVIEELDRIEEFLKWVSFIFPDGSSFEGTVWDDLAHGKGVYVTEQGLVRYEGEWLQNNMEGHGVVEVDIPDVEPIPGSKLEAQMRAEGKIIKRDYMTPEDREWLEMDIEDSVRLTDGKYEIPFYENDEWIRQYGEKPEKGRYRYAGQWKHSRMHGCGVYKVNERIIYGRFYFGELVEDPAGCDEETCALHAGIAEVAAAKARMFINKPDGMVREERGPYSDPQHPYFYEEDDAWQAPGFINQFYEVPDYWKTYVHEVDQEREMWLHSFYKAPLRLPMPAELEYWWSEDSTPEFVLVNKEPEPDPEDPSKLLYSEDPLILHTPTGRLINYIEDEEHGLRLFWQPPLKEGEDVDPEKAQFLPLGFDEFYGKETEVKKENFWQRLASSVENGCKPLFDKWGKWIEEQKKAGEMRLKLIEKELELVELELCLEEAIEDMEEELKQEEEAESKGEKGKKEKEVSDLTSGQAEQEDGGAPLEVENGEEEEEEEDEEEAAPTSFGSAGDGDVTKEDKRGNGSRKSPFSSLSFASASLLSTVPSMLQQSLSAWKRRRFPPQAPTSASNASMNEIESSGSVRFPRTLKPSTRLRLENQSDNKSRVKHYPKPKRSRFHASLQKSSPTASMHVRNRGWLNASPDTIRDGILSLHIPVHQLDSF